MVGSALKQFGKLLDGAGHEIYLGQTHLNHLLLLNLNEMQGKITGICWELCALLHCLLGDFRSEKLGIQNIFEWARLTFIGPLE